MTIDDDPVTAEYDVYITPAIQEQIQLLQYLNRPRDRPYNESLGARPDHMRFKPKSGFVEVDVEMHAGINFNRYQSLKWGDAIQTAKTLQNDTATYGPASGFALPRKPGSRVHLKDRVERENQILNDLQDFTSAQSAEKALQSQTLGGKVTRCDAQHDDAAQPIYFVGAFRGTELHLTKVDGIAQMRPHFHHIDAEDQRNRTASTRAAAVDTEASRSQAPARSLQQSYKDLNDDKDKDAPERRMRKLLQDAEEEDWAFLHYVDEQDELAYETFNQRMFVNSTEAVQTLRSDWNEERYLNEISPARHVSHTRRRKRVKKKDTIDVDAVDESEND